MDGEQLLAVHRAVMALPGRTRHVFLLHRFESYTYLDIARELGVSRKSVEYHMNRALSAVSTALRRRDRTQREPTVDVQMVGTGSVKQGSADVVVVRQAVRRP